MFGPLQSRLVVVTLGMIVLAGCGSYGGGGGGGAPLASPSSMSASVAWTDASGPVAGYRVFELRNGSTVPTQADVPSAMTTIEGVPGDRVRIQVAALDAQGNMGPVSAASDEFIFTDNGVTAAAAAMIAGTTGAGSVATRSNADTAGDTGRADAAEAADMSDIDDDDTALLLAEVGAELLLWEAEAPSSELQLTSLMDGALRTELSFDRPGDDWWVVGIDDFDGDGLTDVLWESATGMLAYSSLAALAETAPAAPLALVGELSADESVVSTGDFDGDGLADLLVSDEANDRRTVWLMNGAGAANVEDLRGLDVAASSVAASGDFDGDGRTDVLWRAEDGSLAARFMDGAVAVAALDVSADPALEALGSGDVDGDGDEDLVVRDSASGEVGVLLMGDRQEPVSWSRSVAAGPGFELADLSDLDGDGADDLLWVSETTWMIGFHAQDDVTSDWVPVEPGGDWLLVSFVQ